MTVNADDHPLMRQFHKATDVKRMVVILSEDRYDAWLQAPAARAMDFTHRYSGELAAPSHG